MDYDLKRIAEKLIKYSSIKRNIKGYSINEIKELYPNIYTRLLAIRAEIREKNITGDELIDILELYNDHYEL